MAKSVKRISKFDMPDQFAKELEDEIDQFFEDAEKAYFERILIHLHDVIIKKNQKAVQFNER